MWNTFVYVNKNQFNYPDKMSLSFLSKVDKYFVECYNYAKRVHNVVIKKFIITSSYRTLEENSKVSKVANSAHTENPCCAIDFWIELDKNVPQSIIRDVLLRNALNPNINFKRLGQYKDRNIIHIDDSPNLPIRIWLE